MAKTASLRHSLPAWLVLFLVALVWSQRAYLPFLIPEKVYAVPGTATFGGTGGLGGNVYGNIFYDHANTSYFLDPNATGTSLAVAGSVGIGTTGPGASLDVVLSTATNGPVTYIRSTAAGGSDGNNTGLVVQTQSGGTNNGILNLQDYNGGTPISRFVFKKGGDFGLGGAITSNITLAGASMVMTSGNVGIGTTGPGYKLDVSGNGRIGGLIFASSDQGSSVPQIYTNTSAIYLQPAGTDWVTAGYVRGQGLLVGGGGGTGNLNVYGQTYLAGNVGIGTTSPQNKFVVSNGGAGGLEINPSFTPSGGSVGAYITSYDRSASAYRALNFDNGGANVTFYGTGNVGIGTTSPGEKLQVSGGEINTLDSSTGYGTQVSGRNRQTGAGTSQYNRGYVFSNLKFDGTNWITTTPSGSGFNDFSGMYFGNGGSLNFVTGQVSTATTNLGGDLANYQRMTILPAGNVGIGTTNPGYKLQVGTTCTVTGTNSCVDFAEMYDSSEPVNSGEVVAIDQDHSPDKFVKKTIEAYQSNIIGIVSTDPAIAIEGSSIGFMGGDHYVNNPLKPAVALAGRVPVKISSSSATIVPGDYLTSSDEPGKAMKAIRAGQVIGKALESWTPDSGKNRILVFVNLSWYDPDLSLTSTGDLNIVTQPNGTYVLADKTGSPIARVAAFDEMATANIKAGLVEAKKLVVDGVDLLKELKTLKETVASQQQQIDALKAEIEGLKK